MSRQMEHDFRSLYRILPVNSCGYYKFQVWQLTKIVISKLHIKHKFMVFDFVLGDDYPSVATTGV